MAKAEPSLSFDESGLLEELLLALVGFHGDLFIDSSDADDRADRDEEAWQLPGPLECTVHVSPDLTWVGESDRQVLGDLLRLGFHFKVVNAFVEAEAAPWAPHHGTRPPSVYRRALAAGLTELLDDYRCSVLALQADLAAEPAPALATLRHRMWPYMEVLPSLHALAVAQDRAAMSPTFSAAALIGSLQAGCRSGLPGVRAAMGRLLWHCNQVMLQQLAAWMMYGMLQDPNKEFFIQQQRHHQQQHHASGAPGAAPPGSATAAGAAAGGAAAAAAAAQGPGGAGAGGEDALAGGAAAAAADAEGAASRAGEEEAYAEWHSGFQVKASCLPPYVSADLAETVLFVGRAVRVLRRQPGAHTAGGGGGGVGVGVGGEAPPLADLVAQFGQAFTALQAEPELSPHRLEALVEALRAHVARALWQLLVGRARLLPALRALRDYCLLARGDLWGALLAEGRGLMAGPPRLASVDADLALLLSRSAARSSAEGDPLLPAFRLAYLRGAEAEAAFQVSAHAKPGHSVPPLDPAWDPLVLRVRLEWPLGLLLGREQLRRYNQLFALLLRLRRMAAGLDEAWTELRVMDRQLQRGAAQQRPARAAAAAAARGGARGASSAAAPSSATPSSAPASSVAPSSASASAMRDLQDLRNNMAHLVGNLAIYIQTDVIEVNYTALEARIAACQDFSELERCHHLFLSTLMVQSFLTVKSLCAILGDIFADVSALCQLVHRADCDASRLDVGALGAVRAAFLRHASGLFNIIGSQRILESFRAPHLQQLVTRLNYNGWYSAAAAGRGD